MVSRQADAGRLGADRLGYPRRHSTVDLVVPSGVEESSRRCEEMKHRGPRDGRAGFLLASLPSAVALGKAATVETDMTAHDVLGIGPDAPDQRDPSPWNGCARYAADAGGGRSEVAGTGRSTSPGGCGSVVGSLPPPFWTAASLAQGAQRTGHLGRIPTVSIRIGRRGRPDLDQDGAGARPADTHARPEEAGL